MLLLQHKSRKRHIRRTNHDKEIQHHGQTRGMVFHVKRQGSQLITFIEAKA